MAIMFRFGKFHPINHHINLDLGCIFNDALKLEQWQLFILNTLFDLVNHCHKSKLLLLGIQLENLDLIKKQGVEGTIQSTPLSTSRIR